MNNQVVLRAALVCLMLVAIGKAEDSESATSVGGLNDLYKITDGSFDSHVEYHHFDIPAGHEAVLAEMAGPGKITHWYITDDAGGHFYAGLVLKVFWDGAGKPAINVPLGDFFGALGDKTVDYQSTPMQISHRYFACDLPMPFSKSAKFVLANDGDKDYAQTLAYGIDYERDQKYQSVASRLQCCWRRSNPVGAGVHTILEISGRGHYVGNFLHVFTQTDGWWGEGDTIFHLDGRTITHTPGTEDEYGACWFGDFGVRFATPTCGYLRNEQKGHSLMYRWYLPNPVRFQKSLKVEIQNQHQNGTPTGPADADDYTTVAFWYQEPPYGEPALQTFAERTAPSRAGTGK